VRALERVRRELQRPVAAHAGTLPYALGLAALLTLGLVVLTGLPLALLYQPSRVPAQLAEQPLSAARGAHAWGSSLLLALVLAHLLRVGWTRAYRAPRTRTWLLGLGALGALLAMVWLGTALRGDQQGHEAWSHAVETLALAGASMPAEAPLGALFWLHVAAVPAALAAALALHVRRVRRLDLAPREARTSGPAPTVPFARHAGAALRVAAPVGAAALLLGLLAPPPLAPAPLAQLEAARAPWPFAWLVPLQDLLGTVAIPLGLGGLFAALALLPKVERRAGPAAARAVLAAVLALVVALGLAALLGPAGVRIRG
jgi:quinol-cytochrome oxidoreductase complex cytochrome b subunit